MLRAKLTAASSAAAANGKTLVEQRQELKQVGTVPSAVCRAQQIDSELSCVSAHPNKAPWTQATAPRMQGARCTLCPLMPQKAVPCTQHISPVVLSCQEQVARQQLQRALDRQEARMSQLSKALAEREAQLAAVRQDASSLREQKTAVENWLDV